MSALADLKRLKKRMSYAKLSQLTGAPENALVRWLTGKHKISQAWETLIKTRLQDLD